MLEGLTIIDLTDERGIYGAKLLSDLGANVIRPEPRDGDPVRKRGPLRETRAVSYTHIRPNETR